MNTLSVFDCEVVVQMFRDAVSVGPVVRVVARVTGLTLILPALLFTLKS